MRALRTTFTPPIRLIVAVFIILALVPPLATAAGQDFYIGLATRVLIFALAAVSLDFILGYGGMISLGHAAYLGIGAYSVGILSFYGIHDGFVHFAVAAAASAGVALLIGASSIRTSGIHFIMITLAFGQMLFYLAISINAFGGDDGLTIDRASDFGPLGSLSDSSSLFYVCYATLAIVLFVLHRVVSSRFGLVLRSIASNEPRARAIGVPTFRYKLAAFVAAAVICGIAGALLANQNLFISPASMHWSRSSEILVMTVLGGMGSLSGGVLGVALYVCCEYFMSQASEHWQVVFGPLIVVFVLFVGRGLMGVIAPQRRRAA